MYVFFWDNHRLWAFLRIWSSLEPWVSRLFRKPLWDCTIQSSVQLTFILCTFFLGRCHMTRKQVMNMLLLEMVLNVVYRCFELCVVYFKALVVTHYRLMLTTCKVHNEGKKGAPDNCHACNPRSWTSDNRGQQITTAVVKRVSKIVMMLSKAAKGCHLTTFYNLVTTFWAHFFLC